MKILVVEDDTGTASFIIKGFKQAGFIVDHVAEGEVALLRALLESYDAAVIDIMLPKIDGLSLIKELRNKNILTPVIILSAKSSVDDRIKGIQAGAGTGAVSASVLCNQSYAPMAGKLKWTAARA